MDLDDLLKDLSATTKSEFASTPEVIMASDAIDVSTLPIVARKWLRIEDLVVVVADLKSSTQLGTGSYGASTASIYEAGTGGLVKIFDKFGADFIQIQGDGVFGIFWGDKRYERAACAGVTIKTNSVDFADQVEAKWSAKPKTGYKVGIANGRVLVKRVGIPRDVTQQEPVWAGKPVNYASKAAQCADRHELVVTKSVWDKFSANDYLAFTCDCKTPTGDIWKEFAIDRLPEGDKEADGRRLTTQWCKIHGEEYCNAILDGKKTRSSTASLRSTLLTAQLKESLRLKEQHEREARQARSRGLSA